MDITTNEVEAHTTIYAYGGYNLSAGERVIVQIADTTELDQACPAGKKLVIVISIRAELSDE